MTVEIGLEEKAIITLRFLSADMVQQANSGHPGLPMGCATIAYVIWTKHLRHNPKNPVWFGRDRFILSGGHGSALLYSLLYLSGYDLSLDDLKKFRQWESRTPGHPEYGLTPGVEVTTGPLGQGFSNGVGMAIAEASFAATFNTEKGKVIDSFIYAIVTDGDMMEGITSEAASFAGHQRLGKLIYLYDDNRITIDGSTDLAFTEGCADRFASYGWQVLKVEDGNNVLEVDRAITAAKDDPRPSLIVCRTIIGYGLVTRQGTNKAHGEPPGEAELAASKEKANWPTEPRFHVPDDVLDLFRKALVKGEANESEWNEKLKAMRNSSPSKTEEFERRIKGVLPARWDEEFPIFPADAKGMATRTASGKIINHIARILPEFMGGSADLAPSTKTWIDGTPSYQATAREGRNFNFGIREHMMGAVVNGLAVFGGVIPFGSTFLTFADYMRPALRLSALSGYPSIWVFTHDSIGVGEDGPTHQPVEHVASLRAIPGLTVIRPADANETAEAWQLAIRRRREPTVLILSRQDLPTMDRTLFTPASGLLRGAYILADLGEGDPEIILMASGSEVQLIIAAGMQMAAEAICVRLVSFPSWELFEAQSREYRESVLPSQIKARISVEAGITMGWEKWVGDAGAAMGVADYGKSSPYQRIFTELGLTSSKIAEKGLEIVRKCA